MEWDEAVSLFAMSQRSRGYAPRTVGNRVELAEREATNHPDGSGA